MIAGEDDDDKAAMARAPHNVAPDANIGRFNGADGDMLFPGHTLNCR
jgi:hypothetical protein